MDEKKLKTVFFIASILLVVIGTTLYMGSYFSGLLFILTGVILFLGYKWLESGTVALVELIKAGAQALMVPVFGIAIAIVLGALVMLASNYDPVESYRALFYGAFIRNWHVSVLNAAPLMFTDCRWHWLFMPVCLISVPRGSTTSEPWRLPFWG